MHRLCFLVVFPQPLFSGLWKSPFPGLGMAVGIFSAYLATEAVFNFIMTPPASKIKLRPSVVYKEAGDFGDTMAEGHKRGGGHH